jgi:hypothetical protein
VVLAGSTLKPVTLHYSVAICGYENHVSDTATKSFRPSIDFPQIAHTDGSWEITAFTAATLTESNFNKFLQDRLAFSR